MRTVTEGGVIFLAVYVGITAVGGLVHERLKVIGEACLEDLHEKGNNDDTTTALILILVLLLTLLLLPFFPSSDHPVHSNGHLNKQMYVYVHTVC